MESLEEKLKKIKDKRLETEHLRSDLIKDLKSIHNRITVRRKEGTKFKDYFKFDFYSIFLDYVFKFNSQRLVEEKIF